MDRWYDVRDTMMNKLIRFCLRRCCIDSKTIRMCIHKIGKSEANILLNEYDETEQYWKEHHDPFEKMSNYLLTIFSDCDTI